MTKRDVRFGLFMIVILGVGIWFNSFLQEQIRQLQEPRLQSWNAMPCHEARNTPVVWVETTSCYAYEELENNVVKCSTKYGNFVCLNRN